MDLEGNRFGRGNRELGGAHDLVSQYKLWPFYEFFCKKSLPLSISETHYLRNVVGDTKIKKGEGMELDQLCKNTYTSEKKPCLFPFDLNVLSEAFHMREMDPNSVSSAKKGLPNPVPNSANQSRENERKNRKSEINRKHKPLRIKNGSCVANNTVRHNGSHPSQSQSKNEQDKKRRAETSYDPSVSKRINTRQ
ncbi:probable mediator of RNA polymerase II transcription subunit 19b [Cicer arietinum]|uniref:Probable mediator of RNA polymerase II transcription subunit 19b n=1 Tax=Cicer arietinum TaxID=3827 RepID=A0A1S3EAF7_CICAR|nr:probable mediator of RNA polymerase II transcription subunit 19b [Cicer arietinum]XP_012572386.1 probable mediator of RNA polymerase II transcription subunit 19b [Cicer arietinum]XP_012572387.1 probable mediator of RNA polymerase II transcription subunit 19b [Cicer arietinum]XP_012572388.1 probable mediator of RNA polymerase II transcription subunit 19b [Cicer arietinum]